MPRANREPTAAAPGLQRTAPAASLDRRTAEVLPAITCTVSGARCELRKARVDDGLRAAVGALIDRLTAPTMAAAGGKTR